TEALGLGLQLSERPKLEIARHAIASSFCQAFAQITNAVRNVGDALFLIAHFALDAQRPPIADFLERLHKLLDIRLPFAERHFLAPGAGHGRPVGILDVDATDVWSENF